MKALRGEVEAAGKRPRPASSAAAARGAEQSFRDAIGAGPLSAGSGAVDGSGAGRSAGPSGLARGRPRAWISLPRLVAFLVASEDGGRRELVAAIQAGESVEELLARKPGRVDYWAGLINDFIQSQFADRTRPVVEVLANAVDAVQGEGAREVDVEVSRDGATLVLDRGKGMNAADVMEKLLIPLLSGKEQLDTIGRFGVGFYSVLQYLKKSGSVMSLTTSDGAEALSILFRAGPDGIEAGFQALDPAAAPKGTEIKMPTGLDPAELRDTLVESMQFNRKAVIRVDGSPINRMESPAEAVSPRLERGQEGYAELRGPPRPELNGAGVDLFFKPKGGNGRVYLTVNGVTIFSRAMAGVDVPGSLVVDFPAQTQLIVSRNKLLVDEFTLAAAKAAIDLAASQPEPYRLLNGLFPLVQALQSNNPSPKNADNIELYLKRALQRLAAEESRPLLPDVEALHDIDVAEAVFLHPSLFESLEGYAVPFPAYEGYRPSWFGRQYRMVLAPFRSEGSVLVPYKDTIFLNAAHAPRSLLGKAALEALLQVRRFGGRIGRGSTWSERLLAAGEWAAWLLLTLLPGAALRAAYAVKDAMSDRRPKDLRDASAYVKAFSYDEIQEAAERQRTWQSTVFQILVMAAPVLGSLLLAFGPLFLFTNPAPWLAFASVLYMVLSAILLAIANFWIYVGTQYAVVAMARYQPRYGAASLAAVAGLLALVPWSSLFFSFTLLPLGWLGLPSLHLASAAAPVGAAGLTLVLPEVLGLVALVSAVVFLVGLRRAFRDAAVLGSAAALGARRLAPVLWRWRRLPEPARAQVRSQMRWYWPKTWIAAALLAVHLAGQDDESLAGEELERSVREAMRALTHHEIPLAQLLQALPIIGRDPGQLFAVLEDYDPAFLRAYVAMAAALAVRHPSLMARPSAAARYAEIWRQDLLMKDRDAIGEILEALRLFHDDRGGDIPRAIRPYLIYLLGQSSVLESEEDLKPRGGELNFRLSELVALYLSGRPGGADAASLAEALAAQQDSPLRMKVAGRALANSANFQSSNPHIFVREVIQNVLDEAKAQGLPPSRRTLRIEPSLREGILNVGFSDRIGMSFETVTRYLLVPNASSKRGDASAVGHFGHGFLSILKGAERVLIKTSDGKGRATYASLAPIRRGGLVVDVEVSLSAREEEFQGTRIDWQRRSASPELEVAGLKSQAITFGSLIDPAELRVLWQERSVNKPKERLAEAPTVLGPVSLFRFLGENTLTQRGLFIKDLDDDLLRFIPPGVAAILLKRGVVVQIPPGVELIRDRSDLARKQEALPYLGNGLARAALKALADLYVSGDVELDEIFPYDFVQFGKQYADAVPEGIRADAERIVRGELIEDVTPYFDSTHLAMLLGSIPTFRLRWTLSRKRWSLLGAFRALQAKEIHWTQLPNRVSKWMLNKSVYRVVLLTAGKLAGMAVAAVLLLNLAQAGFAMLLNADPTLPAITAGDPSSYESWGDWFLRFGLDIELNPDAELFNPFVRAASIMLGLLSFFWTPAGLLSLGPMLLLPLLIVGSVRLRKLLKAPATVAPAKVERDLDAYWALAEWSQRAANAVGRRLKALSGREIRTAFYMTFFGASAEAPQGGRWIAFNLRDVLWGGPVRALRGLMAGRGEGRALRPTVRTLKRLAHELVHLQERPGEWTHDARHRQRTGDALEAALAAQDELEAARAAAAARFDGRLASPQAMSVAMQDHSANEVLRLNEEEWRAEESPWLLPAADEVAARLSADGYEEAGRLERDPRGGFRASGGHPALEAAAAAIRRAAQAGVPLALQGVRIVRRKADAEPVDIYGKHGRSRWLLPSQEGVLFVDEESLAAEPQAGLTRQVVLHGLYYGAPDSMRLDVEDEIARLRLDTREGQARIAENLDRLRMDRFSKLWRRVKLGLLWTGVLLGMAYGMLLIMSTLALLSSGALPLLPTPNLVTLSVLVLPAAWFPLRALLGAWQGRLAARRRAAEASRAAGQEAAESAAVSAERLEQLPGTEFLDPMMKGAMNFLSRRTPIPVVFALFLAFGFLEEYLFRYVLFHVLGSYLALAFGLPAPAALGAAALASAFFFAIMHFPNFRNLRAKDMASLLGYFVFMALIFTAAYWLGGIWVATVLHAMFNTSITFREKRAIEAALEKAGEKEPEAGPDPAVPAVDPAAAAPARRWLFLGGEGQALALVNARAEGWSRRKRRDWLRRLAGLPFFRVQGRAARPRDYEAAEALAAAARWKPFGIGRRRFAKLLGRFIGDLPPEMQGPALAYVVQEEGIALRDAAAALSPEVESYRAALEAAVNGKRGPARVSLRAIDEDALVYDEKGWLKPLLEESRDGALTLHVQERLLYPMAHAARKDGALTPERAAEALAPLLADALARRPRLDPGAAGLAVGSLAEERPSYVPILSLEKSMLEMLERGRHWLHALGKNLFWYALLAGYVLGPVTGLLYRAVSEPGLLGRFLDSRLDLLAQNLSNPWFLAPLLLALGIDVATKAYANWILPQFPQMQRYKLQRRFFDLRVGPLRWRPYIANVLHYIKGPRLWFTMLMPLAFLLGGIDAAANPVFLGLLIGGALGNVGEVLLRHGATDWIPIERGKRGQDSFPYAVAIANAADVFILIGIAGPWLWAYPPLPIGLAAGYVSYRLTSWLARRRE